MIHPYDEEACIQILDELKKQKYLSQLEYDLLREEIDNSAEAFCRELICVYQDRVRLYLDHTATELSVTLNIPLEVAEDVSMGYVYSVLAQTHFYTSPLALLSMVRGNIHLVLTQSSDEKQLIDFMKSLRSTLGVSLGIYSITPYLWRCGIKDQEDSAINLFKGLNKTVFVPLVSLWQLYQDVGFIKLAGIALTINNSLIPQRFIDSVYAHDQLVKRMCEYQKYHKADFLQIFFTDDENFTLLKQSLLEISNYIQYDLLGQSFDDYFKQRDLSKPLHQKLSYLYSYKMRDRDYDLKNPDHRVALMQRIFFSQNATKEQFLNLYPSLCKQLCDTFNIFEDLWGDIVRPKLRLIEKNIPMNISMVDSDHLVQAIQNKSTLFFDQKHARLNDLEREQNNKFAEVAADLQQRNDHYQQRKESFQNFIQERRDRFVQRENEISQFESEAMQNIQARLTELNHSVAECRERIRANQGNRFFVAVKGQGYTVSTSNNTDVILHSILLSKQSKNR